MLTPSSLALVAFTAVALASGAAAQPCTTSWAAPADGNWETAANWTDGVPDDADVACITAAGSYTVTASRGDKALAGLVIGGASGTQTLTTNSRITMSGDGTVGTNGRWTFLNRTPGGSDGLVFDGGTGTLVVEGAVELPDGVTFLTTGGTLDVAESGVFRMGTGASAGTGTGLIRVRGTLEVDAPNNAGVYSPVEVEAGLIRVRAGRFQMSQGTLRNASFEIAEAASVSITSSNSGGLSGVFTVEGTLSGDIDGALTFSSGSTLMAATTGATLDVGGTGLRLFAGSGSRTTLASEGGILRNVGLVTIEARTTQLQGATLRNEGTFRIANNSNLSLAEGARFENTASGLLDLVDTAGISGGPDGGRIMSAGRLVARLDASSSRSQSIQVPVDLTNATVEVAANVRLQMSEGVWQDVAFDVAETGEVLLTTSNSGGLSGVIKTSGTLSGDVQGSLRLSRAEMQTTATGTTLDLGGNGFTMAAGSGGYATLSGGPFVNRTTLTVISSGSGLTDATLLNEGTLRIDGSSLIVREGSSVTNATSATVDLVGPGGFSGSGLFVNEGLVTKTGGNTSSFRGLLRGRPGSELRVLDGQFFFRDEPAENYGAGVLLTGAGETAQIYIGPPLQGTLSPGTPEQPIATLALSSSLRLSPTEGDARLMIDVGAGGASDVVTTQFTIYLGGTLVIRLADGFTPSFGDQWTIVTDLRNNLPQGIFETIEVEGDAGGVTFVVDTSNPGAVVLRAVAGATVATSAAEVSEGEPASFRIRHPASPEPLRIAFETDGTATRVADYTLTARGGVLRTQPGTTETVVSLFARRDADASEGPETVTFRLLPSGDASPVDGSTEASVVIRDAPSSDALAVSGVVPARGENAGTISPTILGTALNASATVHLVGAVTLPATRVEAASGAAGLGVVFDLALAPPGRYDVVVVQGGETATLAGAFEVVPAQRRVRVWADVAGTPAPRFGRWSTYTVFLGNDADADIYDVGLVLRITDGAEIEFMDGILDLSDRPANLQTLVQPAVPGVQSVPLYFKKLPAGSANSFRVRVRPTSPLSIGDDVGVAYELFPPDGNNPATWSGDFEADTPFNLGLLMGALAAHVDEYPPANYSLAAVSLANPAPEDDCPPDDDVIPPIQDVSAEDLIRMYDQGARFNRYYGSDIQPSTSTAVSEFGGFSLAVIIPEAASAAGYTSAGAGGIVAAGISTMSFMRSSGLYSRQVICDRQAEGSLPRTDFCERYPPAVPAGTTAQGPGTGGACGQTGGSFDPNDKFGPAGFGSARYYDPSTVTTPYTIRFENLATASLPAQEVIIVDTLDTAAFDLDTFSLGPIRWGADKTVMPPPGATSFETEVDLSPDLDATLLITASLDPTTGRAVWHFLTLDPDTGDLPEDGTVGFLPPNQTSPEGEGSVSFVVSAHERLASGAEVSNRAEIVFDVNEPIVTPVWTNTVDREAPASTVAALDATVENPIRITVSASDADSGVQQYALFASRNGGDFEFVARSDTPTFVFEGEPGSVYGFYSLTVDAVGNAEPFKTDAEATTTVAVGAEGGPDLPSALSLSPAWPNPVHTRAAFRLGVPEAGPVRVTVFDALGREVARLADGEHAAGWHALPWEASRVATGAYVVRAQSAGETVTQSVTVVR
ncbi:beta strand repeat-containing protein [Rubricoccus marinus]|uniref:DUF7619 domain-containing protein n=1 Tax=Rubricoccus marinus TaxID=716817 RepID=A0A259TZG8_9BACT|nr:T9SS type A sorting domain-containing protein [Rubricoccus marinus]OZC02954.1 hypothetical protein BSZ36_08215 [Rubricoccus marinus]